LVALSLTCSRWGNKIDFIMNKDHQHFLPLSYEAYNKSRRNEILRQLYLKPNSIVDLQRFEFQAKSPSSPDRIFAVPWAPHIIFITSDTSFAIFDLEKGVVLQPFTPNTPPASYGQYYQFVFNSQRKSLSKLAGCVVVKRFLTVCFFRKASCDC
jgi:hypothetical protein